MYEPNVRTFTIIKGAILCTSQTPDTFTIIKGAILCTSQTSDTFTIIKGAILCTSQTSEHSLLSREQFYIRAKRQNIHYYKGSNSM